ncbi:DUF1129 family protein [Weissella fangxianensis]|uniref:DUF1129 family protein n=1 Tax=Weissella fangxianensis TaxID=2953879 RepID=UPI0021583A80|nr:DUF1129 family protein [Weissella fangxianensis]
MSIEDKLIKQNNQLRAQLTEKNEKYYSDLLLYMRLNSFMKDQAAIESNLLEIVQDIIEAQSEGLTAEQYFGKNPQILADELLRQVPKKVGEVFKFVLYFVGAYVFFSLLPSMISVNQSIDIGNLILTGLYIGVVVLAGLKYLGRTIYRGRVTETKNWALFLKLWLVIMIVIVPMIFIQMYATTPLQVTVGNKLGIGIILFWVVIAMIIFFKQSEKRTVLPLAGFSLFLGILGIMTRLPGEVSEFLRSTQVGHTTIGVILGVALVIFWIASVLVLKKK